MKLTFEKSVDILVKAYLNETLKHGDCSACAVGNLLGGRHEWSRIFVTPSREHIILPQLIAGDEEILGGLFSSCRIMTTSYHIQLKKEAIDLCESSGYTVAQLARIENTFELATGKDIDERMYSGLMAVVDVLAEIHGIDFSKTEEAKAMFVR